jgi:hypothetical protein
MPMKGAGGGVSAPINIGGAGTQQVTQTLWMKNYAKNF